MVNGDGVGSASDAAVCSGARVLYILMLSMQSFSAVTEC